MKAIVLRLHASDNFLKFVLIKPYRQWMALHTQNGCLAQESYKDRSKHFIGA